MSTHDYLPLLTDRAPPRLRGVATLLFSIEMLILLALAMTGFILFSQIRTEQHTINTAMTAGLEQTVITPTTASGAYYNEHWNGHGLILQASALPGMVSRALMTLVPNSQATPAGQSVIWTLAPATAQLWHVSGPITITALQATDAPGQSVTLNGQSQTYPYPVVAGQIAIPWQIMDFGGWHWTITGHEAFVLPLAGRQAPHQFRAFSTPQ